MTSIVASDWYGFPRLALFRLTRREKVVEPPKDRSADDAIHQRIDRPGNDRAHPGARTVTREDGPAQLKKRLPVFLDVSVY